MLFFQYGISLTFMKGLTSGLEIDLGIIQALNKLLILT